MARSLPRWPLIALLFLSLVAVLGYWLSHHITWKETTRPLGYSDEARKNAHLAAARFLERQHIKTHNVRSLSPLDQFRWQDQAIGTEDTLVLINSYKMVQRPRLERLLDWVEAGGTLIASTQNPFIGASQTPDLLLDHFQLARIEHPYEDDDEDTGDEDDEYYYDEDGNATSESSTTENDAGNDGADERLKDGLSETLRCNLLTPPLPIRLRDEQAPLLIDASRSQGFDYFGDQPRTWASDQRGVHLAIFDHGRGRVVITGDNHIWENRRIDCHDHAYLLWKLINPSGQVWFLTNEEAPSLWAKLWQATPFGMGAALLALACWLWARSRRFGPLLTRQSQGRRSLAEHIHASARLLWRRQQHPYLVTLLRNQLQREIQQHSPAFEHWPRTEQLAHLAQLSGLAPEVIDKAMFNLDLQHPHDFTRAVACLQTLRKHL